MTLYYGLDFTYDLQESIVFLIRSAMFGLMTAFPSDKAVADDYNIISAYKAGFNPGGIMGSVWKFVQSLHSTTCYLGGRSPPANFVVDGSIPYTYLLTHFYYVSGRLILV
jgi:hypothetical protein